jgi:outer membrane protein
MNSAQAPPRGAGCRACRAESRLGFSRRGIWGAHGAIGSVWRACLALLLVPVTAFAGDTWIPLSQTIHRAFHPETVRVEDVSGLNERITGGKLHLHLKDFLELVLKNSTAIRLNKLDVYTAADQITLAKSPLDPVLTGGFNAQRTVSPQYDQIEGAETLSSLTQTSSLNYQQLLPTGQTINATFDAARNSANSSFYFFNPNLGTVLNLSITQPLLQNRNRIQFLGPLQIARTELLITAEGSAAQIATTLATAAGQYWDAVRARDAIGVQRQNVDLARKSYDHDKQALDLGALGKLDIFQSETQVAERERDLIAAQFDYTNALDALRRQIGADLTAAMRAVEIVLEDDPTMLPPEAILPYEDALARALKARPEMRQADQRIAVDDLNARIARNLLTPQLNLSVIGGSQGLGGDYVPGQQIIGLPTVASSSGIGTAMEQLFTIPYPTYGFSLNFTLPLRNSTAKANLSDSLVNRVRDQYLERQAQQQVTLDVRQAVRAIDLAKATIKAATQARDLARENVAAEQKKYELGSIVAFELLDSQTRLASTEVAVLGAFVGYQEAYINYQYATWTLLDSLGFVFQIPKAP